MSSGESGSDAAYEEALNDHYGVPDLETALLDALAAAGKDVDALTRDDTASFDEFHIRGREATREVARLAGIDADARVLDVGCGVGGPARTLSAEVGCEVVGVDIVEAYCRVAERLTERVGLGDAVRFQHGNALDLPFESGQFDVVWFEHTLLNIDDKGRAFEEAGRVLEPGGRLVLYEICAGAGGEPVFPVPWATDPSLSHLATPAQLRETLAGAGFAEVTWRDVTEASLEWFRETIAAMEDSPDEPTLGVDLLMGSEAPTKATNVVRNLEEDRIAVVQGVFERESTGDASGSADHVDW